MAYLRYLNGRKTIRQADIRLNLQRLEDLVPALHPGILVLTKIKRFVFICESTRPKSMQKASQDAKDIVYLLGWLAQRKLFITIGQYQTDQPDKLDWAVRKYMTFVEQNGWVEELGLVKSVLNDEDRARIEGMEL